MAEGVALVTDRPMTPLEQRIQSAGDDCAECDGNGYIVVSGCPDCGDHTPECRKCEGTGLRAADEEGEKT